MRIEPERLLHTAMAMGGWRELPHHRQRMLERVHSWPMISAAEPPTLMWALREVMELVNKLAQLGQPLLDRLQLDDQVYRLVALMLLPELLEAAPLERLQHRERQGRDSFDELIDYIRANLSQPLNLTELEQRSHYSRRALQYAFRERLGCTASQWIRLQRLDLAQQRLQNPLPEDSVASIAILCGYRSMSLFSVDFQQRFHVKPSQLLREARSAMPMEAATAALKESEEATKT
jgi:AraC-like DNA-binding protein